MKESSAKIILFMILGLILGIATRQIYNKIIHIELILENIDRNLAHCFEQNFKDNYLNEK